jgi:hypothetical protein
MEILGFELRACYAGVLPLAPLCQNFKEILNK